MAVGAVVLAFGAIVLARAHSTSEAAVERTVELASSPDGGGTRVTVETPELTGFAALTQGAILAHGTRELFYELRLEARDGMGGAVSRRPVALSVVLDVSGSMIGEKMEQARRSVHALVEQMHPDDRLAVVVYNDGARVVSPLARVRDVQHSLRARIDEVYASGGTNIPAGLGLGAQVLAEAPVDMVHRMVLISDGLDGSGAELASVQREVSGRANHGTTTSALGVGTDYDERWLTSVADAGRGNYEFIAEGRQLAGFLRRELEQASTTVADRTELQLDLPTGWRLADAYGATPDATAAGARVPLGALFAGERRRVTLRLEVEAGAPGGSSALAGALRYRATRDESDRNLTLARLSVAVVGDEAQVASSLDVALHAEAVATHLDARQAQAVEAWRAGRAAEAQQLARDNIASMQQWQRAAPRASGTLAPRIAEATADLDNFGQVSAGSSEGRAWGLGSNSRRRARMGAF